MLAGIMRLDPIVSTTLFIKSPLFREESVARWV
jgi:hypothetical protein